MQCNTLRHTFAQIPEAHPCINNCLLLADNLEENPHHVDCCYGDDAHHYRIGYLIVGRADEVKYYKVVLA